MYVIGIDGGGTQSRAVLCEGDGHVLATAQAGAVNQNSVAIEAVESAFNKLAQTLESKASHEFQNVTHVFAGVAGTGKEDARLRIQHIIEGIFPNHAQVEVKHDGYNALYAGTLGKPGVVQISGTGSLTFGQNKHGESARAGGWGYLIGDEGSGYAIGRDALSAMARAHDGWSAPTMLTQILLDHFDVNNPHDVIPLIYNHSHPRQQIASLSPYVIEAASQHDAIAQSIVDKTGQDLAKQIFAVSSNLFHPHAKAIPVILTGGVFSRADLFIPSLEQTFDQLGQTVDLIQPKLSPLGGAAVASLCSVGVEIPDSFAVTFMDGVEGSEGL